MVNEENSVGVRVYAIDELTDPLLKILKTFDLFSKKVQKIDTTPLTRDFAEMEKLVSRLRNQGLNKLDKTLQSLAFAGQFESAQRAVAGAEKELAKLTQINTDKLNQGMKTIGLSARRFTNALKENFMEIGTDGQIYDQLTGKVVKLDLAMRKASRSARAFKFEYLSIMFAGMALDRVFGGLIRSQFQLFGVTDALSAMWTIVLLPVMDAILPILFKMIEFFMNLPEPIKSVIGWFILLAAGVGKFLSIWGQAGTFITGGITKIVGGFKWLWTVMGSMVTWVSTTLGVSFGAALGIIIAVIAAVVAVVLGAIDAWKNNFLGFRDAVKGVWEAIKTYVLGFVQVFSGIWDILVGIFTLNGDKIKQGFGKIVEGVKNLFKGVVNFCANLLNGLVSLSIAAVAQIVRAIQWIWNKVPGHKKATWYEDLMALGKDVQLFPSFKEGGMMPYTGLAYLHQGERIIPKEQVADYGSTFSPSITVNINGSADGNLVARTISEELNRQWAYKFSRMSDRR